MQQEKSRHRYFPIAMFALLATLAGPAAAAAISYRVDVDAPSPLRDLITTHLRIIELRGSAEMDLDQLKSLYRRTPAEIEGLVATEGYFMPKITPSLDEANGSWRARFVVDPGPRAQVQTVAIEFAGAITEPGEANDRQRRDIRDGWYLDKTVFRQADWNNAKRIALQKLLANRFPAARITASEAHVDATTSSVELSLTLDSGPAFTIGDLEIVGLERYHPEFVQRLNTVRPGTPYQLDNLQEFQQRLQDTGYFASALVGVDTATETPGDASLKVTVVERPPRRLSFGVGYSTDTKNRVSTEYEDVNFLGRGWRLKSRIRLETLRQELSGEVAFPRTGGGYDPRVFGGYTHENIQGQETRKYGFGGAIGETRGNRERVVSLQYAYEDQALNGAPGNIAQAVFGNFSWTNRAVDNLLFPNRGYLLNLQLGAAPEVFTKSESFVRSYARGAYYLPLSDKGTLLVRVELGYVAAKSRDSIPSDFLFRTGGDTSIRGFAYQGIGVQKGAAIVGGRVLGVASAEYIQWLTPKWGAAIFYDTGDAADGLQDFKLKHGYGLGVRWRSPVGPLNLDVAYGKEAKAYRLHFSIGVAF